MPATCVMWYVPRSNTGLSKHGNLNQNLAPVRTREGGRHGVRRLCAQRVYRMAAVGAGFCGGSVHVVHSVFTVWVARPPRIRGPALIARVARVMRPASIAGMARVAQPAGTAWPARDRVDGQDRVGGAVFVPLPCAPCTGTGILARHLPHAHPAPGARPSTGRIIAPPALALAPACTRHGPDMDPVSSCSQCGREQGCKGRGLRRAHFATGLIEPWVSVRGPVLETTHPMVTGQALPQTVYTRHALHTRHAHWWRHRASGCGPGLRLLLGSSPSMRIPRSRPEAADMYSRRWQGPLRPRVCGCAFLQHHNVAGTRCPLASLHQPPPPPALGSVWG